MPASSVATSDADQVYGGSRFSEVREAVFANPYQKVWGGANEPPLPVYDVTTWSVLRGLLHPSRFPFLQTAKRVVDSAADLRWGPDGKGIRRILHPNGIALTGLWEITADTHYSGYFGTGSRGLIVGRYSTCCGEPRRGHSRSLSMVGKIFPTHGSQIMPHRSSRPTSSRNRISPGTIPTTSTMPSCERSEHDGVATRRRHHRLAGLGRGFPCCRQKAEHSSALSDRRAWKGAGRADAVTDVHAPSGRAGTAADRGREPRFPRRDHGADL